MIWDFVRQLFGIGADTEDEPPHLLPPGQIRLHLFHGAFDNEDEALAYCFDAEDDNTPEQLTRDLPEAYIDIDFVEVLFGETRAEALDDYFPPDRARQLLDLQTDSNTMVIVAEEAFGGFPFRLHDTSRLIYIGAEVTDLNTHPTDKSRI